MYTKNRADSQTPSILRFFKPGNSSKRRVVSARMQKREQTEHALAISWRPDGSGNGARFDHVAFQTITGSETVVLAKDDESVSNLSHALLQLTYELPLGQASTRFNRKLPRFYSELGTQMGLLVLPGVSAKEYGTTTFNARKSREINLIKQARLRGQPILAICGGCWTLYEAYGGQIINVHGHNYRGGMPRLSESTPQITYNKMIHRIEITDTGKFLSGALNIAQLPGKSLPVNSVHSYAPSSKMVPTELTISAWSLADDDLAPVDPHSKTKEILKPERSIEAFESAYGVPILGIQWHPEAYLDSKQSYYADHQHHILKWMAMAGQTYLNRQKVNQEIKAGPVELRKTGLLAQYNTRKRKRPSGKSPYSIYRLNSAPHNLTHPDEHQWTFEMFSEYTRTKSNTNPKCLSS